MKLSIITINYNNREGLRKTIDSVVSQTWQEFEWIIVDGGSSDGSKELIEQTATQLEAKGWTNEQFSGPDDPVSYLADHQSSTKQDTPHSTLLPPQSLKWCSEKDKGVYNAMNKGIVMAQGEYCLFLNSGDCLCNNGILSLVFSYDLTHDIECYNQVFESLNSEKMYSCKITNSSFCMVHLLLSSLPHQASLISSDLLRKVGMYDESLKIVSDWKFYVQAIIFQNASCHYSSIDFARIQPDGISKVNKQMRQIERDSVLAELFPLRVLKDYEAVVSLYQVKHSCNLCKWLYSLLYRLADLINRHKKSNSIY